MFWRLIESPPSPIAFQMDRDRQVFEEFLQDAEGLPILRIFRVSEPGVSVGKRAAALEGTVPFSASSGKGDRLLFCIRPTGGGRVHHGKDFLYSVIARRDSFPTFQRVRTSYLSFHEVVQEALRQLGVETSLVRCDDSRARKNAKQGAIEDCFGRPVPTDVCLGGRKIAGAAQWRRGNAFLHQGSIQIPAGISFESLRPPFVKSFLDKFSIV